MKAIIDQIKFIKFFCNLLINEEQKDILLQGSLQFILGSSSIPKKRFTKKIYRKLQKNNLPFYSLLSDKQLKFHPIH